jgi:hypothetical protein
MTLVAAFGGWALLQTGRARGLGLMDLQVLSVKDHYRRFAVARKWRSDSILDDAVALFSPTDYPGS